MSLLWCPRCHAYVGGLHRCFLGLRGIRAVEDRTKTTEYKLLQRLKTLPKISECIGPEAYLERLYHGYWQRSQGSWCWHLVQDSHVLSLGSQFPMRECLRADHLALTEYGGDWSVDPVSCSTCGATANKTHREYPCKGCDLAQGPVNWKPLPKETT